ncbi:DNA-methyltransferase [Helicobacter cappadocius]|uniref:Methyltransferase n=1 Tax=Helicobacter cappadocius TaxID=3063998 RepID=A0AA90PJW2_9HELI|nr:MULTISPECIES: DNA methyltransferase [unclassified Helicobacter]MDO7252787.1 DNA methyltransferase [Helicobacter sp. faydin-H75]MDP2538830.1 DNA methyltransferase [Helicobacter sp. faydin-H76]
MSIKNDDSMYYYDDKKQIAIYNSDCVELAKTLPDNSIDFSIYSPPFSDLFVYSDSHWDMGNCSSDEEFFSQYRYLIKEMYRVMKPHRLIAVHCCDLQLIKSKDGIIGFKDFPGRIIAEHIKAGFIYHSRVTIYKDPVIEMQRTKANGLLYKQVCKDSTKSRQGRCDYLVILKKYSNETNLEPVSREAFYDYIGSSVIAPYNTRNKEEYEKFYSINVWQRYASPVWFDIDQGKVLNSAIAKDDKDERHMCPLQLDVIQRAIELWSNPNEIVYSPFMGIGSEGVGAINMDRGFIGSELKKSYFQIAKKNIKDTIDLQNHLFHDEDYPEPK